MLAKQLFKPSVMGLLAPIQSFYDDNQVSEIMINKPGEIWIEKSGVLEKHPVPCFHEKHLAHLSHLLANELKMPFSVKSPVLSGNLLDGSRVQLVMPPVSKYYTWAIRRQTHQKITLDFYHKSGIFHQVKGVSLDQQSVSDDWVVLSSLYKKKQWFEFLKQAIQLKKNIVISGGTSSGKTTFLNACLAELDCNSRLIMMEDVREVEAPHSNQVQMRTWADSVGADSMQSLVQCALRLRPDRLIIGEIRGAEIADFIAACSTGHEGSLASIHANSAHLAFSRMVQLYKLNSVPSMKDSEILNLIHTVVDVVVQLQRTSDGRKITEIWYRDINLDANQRYRIG